MIRIVRLQEKAYTAYHNTTKYSYENILKYGFDVGTKMKRKKAYGNGIYFSEQPNPRWGEYIIKVKLIPQNPLLDREGDIRYEDNDLGKEIQQIGNTLFFNFSMTDGEQLSKAIDFYLDKYNIDMLLTEEFNRYIFVVKDESIIHIKE